MHVLIVHQAVPADAPAEEQDVLVQAACVRAALQELGHTVEQLPVTLDLESLRQHVQRQRPAAVFNLVEGLQGSDQLAGLVPALLESLAIPFTGASMKAQYLSSQKELAKERMLAFGLPTPRWWTLRSRPASAANSSTENSTLWPRGPRPQAEAKAGSPLRCIIKPIAEHASVGMGDDAVVELTQESELGSLLRQRTARDGRPLMAESFIPGREFNLSLLAGPREPRVLPPAEIDFSAYPRDKPRIVGYRAKWEADSFEFQHTPRRFEFPASDQPLLDRLSQLARDAWSAFEIRGYARVDFRVDDAGEPWILELNSNPCLSPDAGFAAALHEAGLTFTEAVRCILADCQ